MEIVYLPMTCINYAQEFHKRIRSTLLLSQSGPELWMQYELDSREILFTRQAIITIQTVDRNIYPLFLDFYMPDLNVAIEIDGSQHNEVHSRYTDDYKNNWCLKMDVRLFRIMTHIANVGNRGEISKCATIIAKNKIPSNGLQFGSGFGKSLMDLYFGYEF